jgi:hypothetical protein
MDIGSIFLLLALLIPVALFVARPLLEGKAGLATREEDLQEHDLSHLLAERDRILTALEELDFDHALGKIPEGDYQPTRERLLFQGAEVLRQIDALDPERAEADIERRIEAAIEERKMATAPDGQDQQPVLVDADDEVELQLAARRRAREGKSAGFCPQCGRPVQIADRFCPNCGNTLT